MASEVYINIKDLPELTEINNGDYIIVETSTGTHIINFENFLLPTTNTVITTTVNQNASSFTASVTDLNANISSTSTTIDTLSTNLDALSVSYNTFKDTLTNASNLHIAKAQITIRSGANQGSGVLPIKIGETYSLTDILISPANFYATKYNAYPSSFNTGNGMITLQGARTNPVLTIDFALSSATVTTTDVTVAEEDAVYNVFVIKT